MEEPTFDALDGEAIEQVAAPGAATATAGPSTTRALAAAGIIVTLASLASRILGFVRLVVIARAVPEKTSLDAFYQAFSIPDFLFQLVAAGALASALVPVLAGLFARGEPGRAWRVVSTGSVFRFPGGTLTST